MRYKLLSLTLAAMSLSALSPLVQAQPCFESRCQLQSCCGYKCQPKPNLEAKRCFENKCVPKSNFEVHSYVEGGVDFIKGYSEVPPNLPALLPLSSSKRPTFSELDIDSDLYCGVGIDIKYGKTWWTYLHYQQMTPSNATILNTTLTTLGQTIEAGQLFSMHTHYQWINLGLGVEYLWCKPCLKFTPMIDLNWVDYLYNFSAVTLSGYQNLSKPANALFSVRVGGRVNHQYCDLFSTQLTLMGSPPFLPLTIYEANLSIAYHLYEKDNFRIRPYIGIKWLFMDLDSNSSDTLITHYEARPAVFVGFNFLM